MRYRKNIIREDYFEKIDTEAKAYLLGFLYADGSVSANKYSLIVDVSEKDKHILDLISSEICITEPKYIKRQIKENRYLKLSIGSKKLCSDLIEKGCIPNKTFLLSFPDSYIVDTENVRHFIRGYFDGDGCITGFNSRRPYVTIIGTLCLLEGIQNELKKVGIPSCNIFKISNIYRISLSSLSSNLKFYNYIYSDAKYYYKRKKEKFDEYYEVMIDNSQKTKTSKYKHISFDKSKNKWIITYKNKKIGTYNTEELAHARLIDFYKEIGIECVN